MQTKFAPGQMVISKSGRDKGSYFIVVKLEGKFVYVVDGDLRKIENPKKKNPLHLKVTNTVFTDIAEKIQKGKLIRNTDFRKALSAVSGTPGSEVTGGREDLCPSQMLLK